MEKLSEYFKLQKKSILILDIKKIGLLFQLIKTVENIFGILVGRTLVIVFILQKQK